MNVLPKIIPAVCCIALLSACASNKTASLVPKGNPNATSWSVAPMATKTSNDKPESLYQIGRYYQGQNRYDLAIAAFQRTLAVDNGFLEARNGLGVVYSRQGKYREAIEAFQEALKQAPNAAHIYSNLGYAYYLQGQYAESVAALQQATTLDPANQRALNNLGLAYAKNGNKHEAVQAFSEAVSVVDRVTNTTSPALSTTSVSLQSAHSMASGLEVDSGISPENHTRSESVQRQVVQTLAIPKDRGVIKSSASNQTFEVIHVGSKLVQVASNVYELREQSAQKEPLQATSSQVSAVPVMSMSVEAAQPLAILKHQATNRARIEVANGNGVTGMAAKVGRFLKSGGFQTVRLTNQKPFQVSMTQIQYRDGYQAEAHLLKLSLPTSSSELVQRNDLRADICVRMLLGKDVAAQVASFESPWQKFKLALNLS